jgi:hypothetical protein
MKSNVFVLTCLLFVATSSLTAQDVTVDGGRFRKGDNAAWRAYAFDDGSWEEVSFSQPWERMGLERVNGVGWYRIHVVIPSTLRRGIVEAVMLDMGAIDDSDQTWINGHDVGRTGTFPEDPGGYSSEWGKRRYYVVDPKWVRWDEDNVIAVRVYNYGDPGGLYRGAVRIVKPALKDFARLTLAAGDGGYTAVVASSVNTAGTLEATVTDILTGRQERAWTQRVKVASWKDKRLFVALQPQKRLRVTYRDPRYEEVLAAEVSAPYILTPPAPRTPRYNGPAVYGLRPGSPLIFRLAFSGEKPMRYHVEGLPEGIVLDEEKGALSGSCKEEGDYRLLLTATNGEGSTTAPFTLKVGRQIGLTPPMGWNSWNCWGLSVSQEKVMASAQALIDKGLADYGYAYMNIDDAWEGDERTPDGRITANEKFPDMKALGDWLHANGLKFGIYSCPGEYTCGGYRGSLGHERQDAEVWNSWGVDYLKYDMCGYSRIIEASSDKSEAVYIRPYLKMQEFIREQPRDIFYSLCQYGWGKSWIWGPLIDANSWRTSDDINDTWESLYNNGFVRQAGLHPYAGPGHWNDPDMLIVGKVGWSSTLRDTQLTPDEQYTHISLWSLLAANMLIGCDVSQIDAFTFNLLCNNEVNAVNQDILGHQAHQDIVEDGMQIWSRDLYDGSHAVGIFNLNDTSVPVLLKGALAKINLQADTVRDLWRQKDIPTDATYTIPPHGVLYVSVQLGKQQAAVVRQQLIDEWKQQQRETFAAQWQQLRARQGTLAMPFWLTTFGDKPADGRSLWISLHGGGSAPKEVNDQQWDNQKRLYRPAEGVYCAPRAPYDDWDMWFKPALDGFYEQLIRMAVAFLDVNPDKVYLMGYSAGGDGVWRMAPRMADSWAAASMMAGHPGDVSLVNLRNTPFMIWCGADDSAYDRNRLDALRGIEMDSLQQADPEGYIHQTHIMDGMGHWMMRADTAAVAWMAQYRRNPYPTDIVWQQEEVLRENFYWISVPKDQLKRGQRIRLSCHDNAIDISECTYDSITLWLNDELVDLDKTVTVSYQGREMFRGKIRRSRENIVESLYSRNDPSYAFPAKIQLCFE